MKSLGPKFLFRNLLTVCFTDDLICLSLRVYFSVSFMGFFEFYFIFFVQQVVISHQFYTHQCIHVNPNLPVHPTTTPPPPPATFPPWCPYV